MWITKCSCSAAGLLEDCLFGLSIPHLRFEWWFWSLLRRPCSLYFVCVEQMDFCLEKQREQPMSDLMSWQKSSLIRRRKNSPHLIAGESRAPPSRGHHCPLCWGHEGMPSDQCSLPQKQFGSWGVPLGCCCSEESRRSLIHTHIYAPSFVQVSTYVHAYVHAPNPSLGNASVSFARGFLCLFKSIVMEVIYLMINFSLQSVTCIVNYCHFHLLGLCLLLKWYYNTSFIVRTQSCKLLPLAQNFGESSLLAKMTENSPNSLGDKEVVEFIWSWDVFIWFCGTRLTIAWTVQSGFSPFVSLTLLLEMHAICNQHSVEHARVPSFSH